jgi:hypothetical protein
MSAEPTVRVYQELAACYDERGEPQMRDRFLVLAADEAFTVGLRDEAENLRARLLKYNPHHLLKPYTSYAEAMKSTDVRSYVAALRRSHPHEKAVDLLRSLQSPHPQPEPDKAKPAIPPTDAGNIEIPREEEPRSEPEIYAVREPEPPPKAPPPKAPPPKAPKPKPAARNHAPAGPRPVPPVAAARPPTGPRPKVREIWQESSAPVFLPPAAPDSGEREHSGGVWVASLLFLLTLLGGVALGAYTLLRPFVGSLR